jgi:membrane fusion protein (multidrug efflux system)
MKKTLISLFVLAVLAGSAYYAQRTGWVSSLWSGTTGKLAESQPAPEKKRERTANISPVEVAAASTKTMSDDITAVGSLLSDESVQIAAETAGRVSDIKFTEGDVVAAGEILITLDDTLVTAQREDAQARLSLAQANYERAGEFEAADRLAEKGWRLFLQGWEKRRLSPENYHPETGERLDHPDTDPFYYWTALLPIIEQARIKNI